MQSQGLHSVVVSARLNVTCDWMSKERQVGLRHWGSHVQVWVHVCTGAWASIIRWRAPDCAAVPDRACWATLRTPMTVGV